jgi:ATP-dependent protease ClpP protease subunit
MKKILCMLVILFVVLTGCATIPQGNSDTKHDVNVVITTQDGQKVECKEDTINWEKPGILKPSQLAMVDEEAGRAWIKLFSGLSVSDTTRMQNDFLYLEQKTDIRDVTLLINSPGGSAFDGLAMADIVADYQKKGWTVRAEARGIVASAAVPIFAQCRPRVASHGTIFMVHEAALWKWPGRETASDIRSQNDLMGLMREKYMKILVSNSKLSEDEWLLLEARTSWFSVEKAREYGLLD